MTLRKRASAHYDNPVVISYNFGVIDFGAGTNNDAIKPPYGFKNGRVIDVHVAVRETFTQVTTAGFVRVGTAADADLYAELNMGGAAITDAYNTGDNDAFLVANGVLNRDIDMDRDGSSGAAITQLEVAFIAPTGGTPAGIGIPTIVIGWW